MRGGAASVVSAGTGSETIADLLTLAAVRYADRPAIRAKRAGDWTETSYRELGNVVKEVSLGLVEHGIGPGDKVSILADTRPEWTYACFGALCAGATVVSIYQTSSPQECRYVLQHSESRAVFVEDSKQLAKVRAVEAELPELRLVVVMDPGDDDVGPATALEELRGRGRPWDEAALEERVRRVTPDDDCLYIYTSGTTGPPKGCVLSHGNYRAITSMVERHDQLEQGDLVYLFLPLAHAFALLIQFVVLDLGGTIAYWQRDAAKIVADLMEVEPAYFPSVPRMFEKIYSLATQAAPDEDELRRAVELGVRVRQALDRAEPIPEDDQGAFERAEERLYRNVRGLFGANIRQCVTGAAPIAPEILEFFYACGVPVMEGYGLTETATAATVNTPQAFRFGSVGRPLPGVEVRLAEDGEVLLRGPNIFRGYFKDEEATRLALAGGWLRTGDLGQLDADGFLYITGRKKDIIVTAGGKNVTPANLENELKRNRLVSHAIVVGDRRPYLAALVTLDPDESAAFAERHGLDAEQLHRSDEVRAEIQRSVDELNATVGRVEQIKRFEILPRDLSQDTGELTPTLKVKRRVVGERFADVIDALYGG